MAVKVNIMSLLLCSVATLALNWTCSPLHLTPLLDREEIDEARFQSKVKDPAGIIPESYSGFITVDKTLGNHYFFWFFPNPNIDAPIVIWLNGGPGVPSMFGLIYENGPIKVKKSPDGEISYQRRENSWSEAFSMLYIDNPVGVGYSYSDSGHEGFKNQDGYSVDLYNFIEQFYVMFPEYLEKQLYIGGQSYAGKYVPDLAYVIHQKVKSNNSQIPLAGIYLGGPFFDPETESSGYIDYVYTLGAISYAQLVQAKEVQAEFFENLKYNDTVPSWRSQFFTMFPWFHVAALDNYVKPGVVPYEQTERLMSDTFRTSLHVGHSCEFRNVDSGGTLVRELLEPDFAVSVKEKLAELMDNYKVLIFNGEFDAIVTSNAIEAGLLSTPWSLQAKYNASERSVWYPDNRENVFDVNGFYQHVGQFCRVVVRGAGHQTPHDQPDVTLEMMRRFVEHGCI